MIEAGFGFDLCDKIPIGKSRITLGARSPVNRHPCHARIMSGSYDLVCIAGGLIPPRADLDGNGNLSRDLTIAESVWPNVITFAHGCACALFSDLVHRTNLG